MRLRVFNAPTVAEAMRKVRAELGDDAIIVSTQKSRQGDGFEITAAIEQPEPEPAPAPAPSSAAPRARGTVSQAVAAATHDIARALAFHGVDTRLVERLCLAAMTSEGDVEALLTRALAGAFRFQPTPSAASRPIMLIGPPGAGKTVTAAKLLARDVLAGVKVQAVTCDTARAGGVEQLGAFTRVMDVPLVAAEGPIDLARAVAQAGGRVVIDTAGANPFDPAAMRHLGDLVAAAAVEPVLVLPAGGDAREMAEAAAEFAALGANSMIVTRLDAARRIGGLLMALEGTGLAIADASMTPFVGEGLHPLTAPLLARMLLGDPNRPHDRTASVGSPP